ncbi:MAG TPA: GTPase ObgE [Candidatus Binatia bacterium]|jgi:GTP-binding protein|nr:GTPase ObgE [Candidatus Binatia bacterium]
MFIDEIRVYARAGHGGKGCVAFQREKYRPKGGPSGGNGGRGGDVILEADHDLNNLIGQYYQPRLLAQDGQGGLGKGMDGRAGKDLVIKVPCGTLVWKLASSGLSGEEAVAQGGGKHEALPVSLAQRQIFRTSASARAMEVDLSAEAEAIAPPPGPKPEGELVSDLTEHGQRFVLCKAGRGGLGNRNFATAARQAPRFAQPGEPGEEGEFLFELRIIAEVGLVGYPNAGKSTLLTAISHARPKVASYPFTTLHPQIGIVEYPDFHRLTVCDVPGLIEGAHRNVGLGHEFLRHIERCKVLVALLDMAGADGRAPWDDYKNLLNELELYDPGLLDKPRLVVANKMDEPVAEANLKTFKRKVRKTPVLPIAAAFDEGLEKFKQIIREAVGEAAAPQNI